MVFDFDGFVGVEILPAEQAGGIAGKGGFAAVAVANEVDAHK